MTEEEKEEIIERVIQRINDDEPPEANNSGGNEMGCFTFIIYFLVCMFLFKACFN